MRGRIDRCGKRNAQVYAKRLLPEVHRLRDQANPLRTRAR